jgi:hypothetical protein
MQTTPPDKLLNPPLSGGKSKGVLVWQRGALLKEPVEADPRQPKEIS